MNRQEADSILKQKFGIDRFYDNQWVAVESLLSRKRVLMIEKTGYGKSLCFQFPALLFEGTTVVFSPLISLMRDQTKKLNALGISTACINSNQTKDENDKIISDAKAGKIKILYIAPERQENDEWITAAYQINISMIVIDEAHCISVWGHDFRPAFRRIVSLVNLMPGNIPILATTATATERVDADIAEQIGGNLVKIRGNLMRSNLRLHVIKVNSENEKMMWLAQNISHLRGTGIIYTGTRVNTEIYSRFCDYENISSIGYNAGLDPESRKSVEDGLMNNKWKCVISTNALGMGIDKPDIGFIIHTQIPQSPIHYYQEIGRAGRDGNPADIILFYAPCDIDLPISFIENSRPAIEKYNRVISAVKSELLRERELMKRTNLKQNQVRVIKADLIEQKIIREIKVGKNKMLEYIYNAPEINTKAFNELREEKRKDLDKMIEYVETNESRMKFLCDYLGDNENRNYNNCDNSGVKKYTFVNDQFWTNKIVEFWDNYFPELETTVKNTNLVNGVASSYYGFSNTGLAIHKCKYENGGDYPEFLIKITIKAYYRKLSEYKPNLLVYVPPTKSGNLVRNFAEKISQQLSLPISHNLVKSRQTAEQKIFENSYLKSENIKEAFSYSYPTEIIGKTILLIDDIYDSGATIKEIGTYLSNLGAKKIVPLVIAKTVGGDSI